MKKKLEDKLIDGIIEAGKPMAIFMYYIWLPIVVILIIIAVVKR